MFTHLFGNASKAVAKRKKTQSKTKRKKSSKTAMVITIYLYSSSLNNENKHHLLSCNSFQMKIYQLIVILHRGAILKMNQIITRALILAKQAPQANGMVCFQATVKMRVMTTNRSLENLSR